MGDCVKDPNLRCTTIELAKVCAGMPFALVTVSKVLNTRSLYEWKNTLQLLGVTISQKAIVMRSQKTIVMRSQEVRVTRSPSNSSLLYRRLRT